MNPDYNSGLKNFLPNSSKRRKESPHEECIVCKDKVFEKYHLIPRCTNCGGALCRKHRALLVSQGGPYSIELPTGKITGLCKKCYDEINGFQPNEADITIKISNKQLKANIRQAQNLIKQKQIPQSDIIIDNIFKLLI